MRLLPLLPLFVAGGLFVPFPAARAQGPGDLLGTQRLAKADFNIRLQRESDGDWEDLTTTEAEFFFNRARCECREPVRIVVELSSTGLAKRTAITTGNIALWVGPAECIAADTPSRTAARDPQTGQCRRLGMSELTGLARSAWIVETTVFALFSASTSMESVCERDTPQNIWLEVDENKDGTPDLAGENEAPRLSVGQLDGVPPPTPTGINVVAGNGALTVSWEPLTGITDWGGYVVLCSRGGSYAVFNPSYYSTKQYQTQATLCGETTDSTTVSGAQTLAAETLDAVEVEAPAQFRELRREFVCSDLLTSQTSTRISGLQNGIPYQVGVAAVDRRGNASPIQRVLVQTPIPTRDFWRGYKEAGGEAQGGYCALASAGAHPPGAALAVGGLLALVLGFRRRRRSR